MKTIYSEKIVDDMTLFDDDLMSMVFDANIPATELVLKIMLTQNDYFGSDLPIYTVNRHIEELDMTFMVRI